MGQPVYAVYEIKTGKLYSVGTVLQRDSLGGVVLKTGLAYKEFDSDSIPADPRARVTRKIAWNVNAKTFAGASVVPHPQLPPAAEARFNGLAQKVDTQSADIEALAQALADTQQTLASMVSVLDAIATRLDNIDAALAVIDTKVSTGSPA